MIATTLKKHRYYLFILFITWGVYFGVVFSRMIMITSDGVFLNHHNVWSDWSLHIGMSNIFALKPPSEWFLYHPFYAHGQFTYGFLTNFISGMMMRLGFSLPISFFVPSIIFALTALVGLYAVFYQVMNSSKKSIVAINIFLLSSGMGFVKYLREFYYQPTLRNTIYPPKDYTGIGDYQWFAGNIVSAILLPQRAFLIGLAIGTTSLACFLFGLTHNNRKSLVAAGILAGLLPIAHMHTLFALMVISGLISIFYWQKWRALLWYVIPAGILSSMFYYTFIHGGIKNPDFISVNIGWTSKKDIVSWIKMWHQIWGIMLPVATISYVVFFKTFSKLQKIFFASFFAIFLLANTLQFQPIAWDNSKMFFWAYLGFSLLSSHALALLWREKMYYKFLALVLFILLTFTGSLEILKIPQTEKNSHLASSTTEILLAENIRHDTKTDAIFLTDTAHNHPIMMWAVRPILLGYTPWAWNFGFDYQQTERDIPVMYGGGPQAIELLKKHNISYVYIGDREKTKYTIDYTFFSQFPLAFSQKDILVYDVRSL